METKKKWEIWVCYEYLIKFCLSLIPIPFHSQQTPIEEYHFMDTNISLISLSDQNDQSEKDTSS